MESGFYPKVDNIGENCLYWDSTTGCEMPKIELIGRRSCEGIIDDVCLFKLGIGEKPKNMTDKQANIIKNHPAYSGINLPPGNAKS